MDGILHKITKIKSISKLDVMVVDDGSKDNTSEFALKYAQEFPDSIRVISKENGGHGSAINTGIQYAKGKYFKVVDADDWLDPVGMEEFIAILESDNTDLVFTPFWIYNDKTKAKRLKNFKPKSLSWNRNYSINDNQLENLPSIHCYTIKTSILKNHDVKIDEHAYYVDVEYITYPLPYVKSYKFVDTPIYFYRVNQGEQSISIEKMKKNKEQHEFVLKRLNEYVTGIDSSISVRKLMVNRLSKMVAAQFKIISLCAISKETIYELRSFNDWVLDNTEVNLDEVNLPIRILVKTNFWALPIIHCLAILKMKVVHA